MKIQHLKFKKLRNRVNSLIKKDVIQFNDNRIENAKDEKEIWKVVKEITTTKSSSNGANLYQRRKIIIQCKKRHKRVLQNPTNLIANF